MRLHDWCVNDHFIISPPAFQPPTIAAKNLADIDCAVCIPSCFALSMSDRIDQNFLSMKPGYSQKNIIPHMHGEMAMFLAEVVSTLQQGSYSSWKTWKVMEFYNFIFQAWKVLKFTFGSWKVMENQYVFYEQKALRSKVEKLSGESKNQVQFQLNKWLF